PQPTGIPLGVAPVVTPTPPPQAPPVQQPVAVQEPVAVPEQPDPLIDPAERAFQRVLEVNSITEEEFLSFDTNARVTAIDRAVQAQVPGSGISTAEFTQLVKKELPDAPSPLRAGLALAGTVEQAGREIGALATTSIRQTAEPLIPGGGQPSLEAAREGGLQGAIERSIDVSIPGPVPLGPADVLNPLNLIAIPLFDPAVARILGFTFKTGARITRSLLNRLGREAAEQATSEALSAGDRIALREFSEEVERAAVLTSGEAAEVRGLTGSPPGGPVRDTAAAELPTGLPGPARAVEPAPVAPARAVPARAAAAGGEQAQSLAERVARLEQSTDDLADQARDLWRLQRRAEAADGGTGDTRLLFRLNEIDKRLKAQGVEIIDRTGTPYGLGETTEVIINDAPAGTEKFIVSDVIQPTVKVDGKIVVPGQVVIDAAPSPARAAPVEPGAAGRIPSPEELQQTATRFRSARTGSPVQGTLVRGETTTATNPPARWQLAGRSLTTNPRVASRLGEFPAPDAPAFGPAQPGARVTSYDVNFQNPLVARDKADAMRQLTGREPKQFIQGRENFDELVARTARDQGHDAIIFRSGVEDEVLDLTTLSPARAVEPGAPTGTGRTPGLGGPSIQQQTGRNLVFHETSPDTAMEFLNAGTVPLRGPAGRSGIFVSDAAELALGQQGKGATVVFRADRLTGRVSRPVGQSPELAAQLGTNFRVENALDAAVVEVRFTQEAAASQRTGQIIQEVERTGNFFGRPASVTRGPEGSAIRLGDVPAPVEPGAAPAVRQAAPDPPVAQANPVERLTALIKEAKPVRKLTERLKSRELSRRVGRVAGEIERGEGEQAFIRAKGQLKGELPKAAFEPPRESLGPSDVTDLFNQVRTAGGLTPLNRVNVADALTKILAGELPTRGEIVALEKVFGADLAKAILSKRPLTTRAFESLLSAANLPRSILTAFDLSAPLRQGALLIGHPKEFFGNFPVMIRAFAKQSVADEVATQLAAGPQAARREAAGLFIADIGEATTLAAREEAFMTTLASKIPGVRQSQRAYVTYLNKLRADTFDNTVAGWERLGISAPEDEAALANMLNVFSGRGSLGPLNEFAPILNQAFFSSRLLASRVQAPLQLFSSSKLVRQLAARDLAAFVGTGIGILSMAKLAGADVELDPRSSNFAKIRVGPTRLDFWAGFQPIARYIAQAATGERKSALGNIGEVSLVETATRFLQSKLSPQAGAAVDIVRGETFIGEEITTDPTNIRTQLKNRLTPLFLQDLWDGVQEAGVTGAFLTLPAAFGASAQSYRTLSEEIAAQIAADIETGAIGANYDVQPLRIGELDGSDAQKFRELHPELIARQEEQFAGAPGDDQGRYFRLTEAADDGALENFGRIQESASTGVYGDFSEQDARRTMWDSFKDTLTRRAGSFETAERRYPSVVEELRNEEAISPTGRALKKYFELQRRHSNRETEEQWAAYEADLERTLNARELRDIERQLVVEDHDLEKVWHDLNDGLEPYYEIPAEDDARGSRGGNAREEWRRQHPQQDAQLWVLGRVSRVLSTRAANIGQRLGRRVFGQSVQPSRGGRSGRAGR
ncbi:hypothetical protein LCGC14_1239670, partial [marine sediment metagenome]